MKWDRLKQMGRIVRAGALFAAAIYVLWCGLRVRDVAGPSFLVIIMCFGLGLILSLIGMTVLLEQEEQDAA